MDKNIWLELSKQQRAEQLKTIISQLVEIDKQEYRDSRVNGKPKYNKEKYNLEQQILEIISWEKEENEEN